MNFIGKAAVVTVALIILARTQRLKIVETQSVVNDKTTITKTFSFDQA